MINIFETELEKGTGIPYLLIKNKVLEASPEADEILLNNIVRCNAYDPQCEGLRAGYMFSIVSNYQNKEKIYSDVLKAFEKMTGTDWGEQQIFTFVCKMAEENLADKKILYDKMQSYIADGKDDLYTMYDFIENEGLSAAGFTAVELGKYIEKNPGYEFYMYDGFFSEFKNKDEVIEFLDKSENKYVKLYLKNIHKAEERVPYKRKTADEIIENYYEKNKNFPLGVWLKKAEDSEIKKIAQYILTMQNKNLKYSLISRFDEVKFPFDYEVLKKEYFKVKKLDYKIKILNAMLLFDNPKVKELIYDLDFDNKEAVELNIKSLCIFYSEEDDDIILEKIDSLDIYSCHDILKFLINNKKLMEHKQLYRKIVYKLYYRNKCSLCREDIFDKMVETGILSKTVCEESMYDCNEETAEKARTIFNECKVTRGPSEIGR